MSEPKIGDIWMQDAINGGVRLTQCIPNGFKPAHEIPRSQILNVAETLLTRVSPDDRRALAKRLLKEEKRARKAFKQQQRDAILFIFNKLREEGQDVTMVEMTKP